MPKGADSLLPRYGPILAKRCGWYCHYCGVGVYRSELRHKQQATIDHKIPKSKGGTDEIENLCLSCLACNEEKADGDYQEMRDKKAKFRRLPRLKRDRNLVDI